MSAARPGAFVAAALVAFSAAHAAQDLQNRPIRMIVAVAAGGSTDIVARAVALPLSERVGQQVVVDNRPGAGGVIGLELVAGAPPDGHTLIMGPGSFGTINSFFPKAPDVQKDLAPIALLATSPYLLVVQSKLPVTSVKELIAYAKERPGKLTYSGSTVTSLQRLSGEHLKRMAGIDLLFVPYKGTGALMPDLLGGRLDVAFDNVLVLTTYVKSGQLRALAVTGAKRSVVMPDVPTISEAGVPGFQSAGWFGIFGPAKTPHAIVARLNTEFSALMDAPGLRDRLIAQGAEPLSGPPEALRKHLAREVETWSKLIREAALKVN
ncbi:MAG: tripartite tricarboxylate transporter substrate binding protein [Burkholderiales bacterium]|nr:tripartite tricarboxylate transporter substrate binding protein [Burkholderiales bacterium]